MNNSNGLVSVCLSVCLSVSSFSDVDAVMINPGVCPSVSLSVPSFFANVDAVMIDISNAVDAASSRFGPSVRWPIYPTSGVLCVNVAARAFGVI